MPANAHEPRIIIEPGIEPESHGRILRFDAALRRAPIESAQVLRQFSSVAGIHAALSSKNTLRDQLPPGTHLPHAEHVLGQAALTLGSYLDVTHFRYDDVTEAATGSKTVSRQIVRLTAYVDGLAAQLNTSEAA